MVLGRHWKAHRRALAALLSVFLMNCSGLEGTSHHALSDWDEQIGCPFSHRQGFFNPYYTWISTHPETPPEDELLLEYLEEHSDRLTPAQQERLLIIHRELIRILYALETVEERLQLLAEMDLGTSSTSSWFTQQ